MIRPALLPDEIDRGYLGRVIRWNGLKDDKEAGKYMAQLFGVSQFSRKEVTLIELLSKTAGLTLQEFVQRHTMLPLRRGIAAYQPERMHGSKENIGMLINGMQPSRPAAYFCPHCMKEDVDFHGFSYWRREMQIPGVFGCPKHATPLRYIESKQAFLSSPADVLEPSSQVSEALTQECSDNPYIKKFLDICAGLLDRDHALDARVVVEVLKNEAARQGFGGYSSIGNHPRVSDRVVSVFGEAWLAHVSPQGVTKSGNWLREQIDGRLEHITRLSAVTANILASSILFPSADEALKKLSVPERNLEPRAAHTISVMNAHQSYNLGSESRETTGVVDAAYTLFKQGVSLAESAVQSGISSQVLEKFLRSELNLCGVTAGKLKF